MDQKPPPDGGYRALSVVFGSFMVNGLVFGLINSYSVLYEPIKDAFVEKHVENAVSLASLIGSLSMGTTFFLSMFAGIVSDLIGLRWTTFLGGFLISLSMIVSSFFTHQPYMLIFTYSILFGTGASFVYIPSLTIIGHYFKKYIGIANGVVTMGSSLFSVVMPYALGALLNFGLDNCLRCIGIILSTLMLCSFVFKPMYTESKGTSSSREENFKSHLAKFINLNIWKKPKYIIWVISVPLALCGYFVPYVYMAQFINENYKDSNTKLPLSCMAITSGIGRLIFGRISDSSKVNSIALQQLSFLVIGVVSILVPLMSNYYVFISLYMILGIFDGCFISVVGPIAFQICGAEGAGQAIGFVLGFSSFSISVGPPVAGWLYQQMKSFTLPYMISGIPPILGAILLTRIHFIKDEEKLPPVSFDNEEANALVDRSGKSTGNITVV